MKRIVFLSILFLLIPISRVHAAIVFSEVMYDPPGTDSPWIEVYNNGTQSVDLTKYYLYTDGPASTRHGITKKGAGTTSISPGGYAIIADDEVAFAVTHSGLTILDSSFTISSTNNSVLVLTTDTIKPPTVIDDQITLNPNLGAKNDGNSLQKNSLGVWISALPTPGIVNNQTNESSSGASDIQTNNTNTDVSQVATGTTVSDVSASGLPAEGVPSPSISKINIFYPQVKLSLAKNGTIGVPVNITTSISGVENIRYGTKAFRVSFGDGTEESDYNAKSIAHTYKYPGTYVVYFEYSSNPFYESENEILFDRKTIEITAPQIVISKINPDGTIELTNKDGREINISGWKIRSLLDPDIFLTIPFGTFILAGKKITLATNSVGFSNKNTQSLILSLPSGDVAVAYDGLSDYEIDTVPLLVVSKIVTTNSTKKSATAKSKKTVAGYSAVTLSKNDIATSVNESMGQVLSVNSFGGMDNEQSAPASWVWYVTIIAIAIAGIALGSILAFRFAKPALNSRIFKNDKTSQDAVDDIRILDD